MKINTTQAASSGQAAHPQRPVPTIGTDARIHILAFCAKMTHATHHFVMHVSQAPHTFPHLSLFPAVRPVFRHGLSSSFCYTPGRSGCSPCCGPFAPSLRCLCCEPCCGGCGCSPHIRITQVWACTRSTFGLHHSCVGCLIWLGMHSLGRCRDVVCTCPPRQRPTSNSEMRPRTSHRCLRKAPLTSMSGSVRYELCVVCLNRRHSSLVPVAAARAQVTLGRSCSATRRCVLRSSLVCVVLVLTRRAMHCMMRLCYLCRTTRPCAPPSWATCRRSW